MKISELLKNKIVMLDGAMGTSLQRLGLKAGEQPELLNITSPQLIKSVHRSFIDAGAQIIYTNTFGANRLKLKGASVSEVITSAVKLAKEEAGDDACVALDVGPIGKLFEPMGDLTFDLAYDVFKEMVVAGEKAGADLVVFETFSSLAEMRCAVLATKENTRLPIFTTMTFEKSGRTFTGVSASAFATTMSALGVNAVGVNCSLGPKDLASLVKEIAQFTDLPVIAKPNAGLPDGDGNYALDAKQFAVECEMLIESGATIVGGCCGTTHEFISELKRKIDSVKPNNAERKVKCALCSDREVVIVDRPLMVGESINPSGNDDFKNALLSGDTDYAIDITFDQMDYGANILDVNVGVAGADESALMSETVKGIMQVCSLPLSIDSADPKAIESGLRAFVGKAILNSTNGTKKSLNEILPIAKKYGAMVVGMCTDEKGIPSTAQERFEIAKRIVESALMVGIKKDDIIIDCVTLASFVDPSQSDETIKAIKLVKDNLGVKTILGISNVSYGIPNRDQLNAEFLARALNEGLDFAIMDVRGDAVQKVFSDYAEK